MWVAAATSDTALCSFWAAVKMGEECVQSASTEQKAKRGKDTGGEVRRRGEEEEEGEKSGESNERWERVCKEKTKTLSKSWSCFWRRLVVVVVGWVRWGEGGGRQRRLPQRRSGWAGGLLSGGDCGRRGKRGGAEDDVGLSGSLAGRDTTPCDWGRARVSERGRRRGAEVKACLMR